MIVVRQAKYFERLVRHTELRRPRRRPLQPRRLKLQVGSGVQENVNTTERVTVICPPPRAELCVPWAPCIRPKHEVSLLDINSYCSCTQLLNMSYCHSSALARIWRARNMVKKYQENRKTCRNVSTSALVDRKQ